MKRLPELPGLAISVNADEYFILLRDGGMVDNLIRAHPAEARTMTVHLDRVALGAILAIPVTLAQHFESFEPLHSLDQSLRNLIIVTLLEDAPPTPLQTDEYGLP